MKIVTYRKRADFHFICVQVCSESNAISIIMWKHSFKSRSILYVLTKETITETSQISSWKIMYTGRHAEVPTIWWFLSRKNLKGISQIQRTTQMREIAQRIHRNVSGLTRFNIFPLILYANFFENIKYLAAVDDVSSTQIKKTLVELLWSGSDRREHNNFLGTSETK